MPGIKPMLNFSFTFDSFTYTLFTDYFYPYLCTPKTRVFIKTNRKVVSRLTTYDLRLKYDLNK